ncbi:MAG: glycosyltransferase family 39 protein [Planctomycetota bacterium]|nr:glycosyltransferase family 39 protein [Planctomycetota bacterium]MDA1113696.1 glycosyltransferase family 39 protein [Planctomycetota bacterium]
MKENLDQASGGLEFDLIGSRQLLLALGLGAVPAFLAWMLDAEALQSWDIPVAASILVFGVVLALRAHPNPLAKLPWKFAFLIALVPPLVAMFALDGPVTNDERAYVFQAELMADGAMAEALPHAKGETDLDALFLLDSFRRRQVFEDLETDRRFSKYAPGTSMALAPGVLVGNPMFSTLLAAMLDLWLILLIAKRLGLRTPGMAVLLLGTSPFFLLMHTSMQSEVFTLPAVMFGYLGLLHARAGSVKWAIAVGAAAGWVFLSRPLTGLTCALIFGFVLAIHKHRLKTLPLAVLGGVPFLALAMWWNYHYTGDAFKPVYALYAEKYGPWFIGPEKLPQDVYGNGDFFAGLLRQSGRWAVAIGGMLGGAGLAFWGTWRLRKRDGGAAILIASGLPMVYSLHWYAGHRAYLGPLYAAESLAFLCLGLLLLMQQAPVAWRRGLLIAMVSTGGVVFTIRWDLIQTESFARSAPQRVVQAEAPPDAGAVIFLPPKYKGDKEHGYKYWTPSSPAELDSKAPVILRTSHRMTPQRLVQWLGLEGRPLYGFVPAEEAPLGGYLQPLNLDG